MSQSAVTPFRESILVWDVPEPVAVEQPFDLVRNGNEIRISPLAAPPGPSQNVVKIASGCWALKALQDDPQNINERADTANAIVRLPDFTAVTGMVERPVFKQANLTGISYDPAVQQSGDHFIQKTVGQPQAFDWAQSLAADIAAFGQPTLATANVPMDRLLVSNAVYQADQGWFIRWIVPGTSMHSPDIVKTFYFGGQAHSSGLGTYALAFSGAGKAFLFERVNGQWIDRAAWEYTTHHHAANHFHCMKIVPHVSARGSGFIEFTSGVIEAASPRGSIISSYVNAPAAPTKFVYTIRQPDRNPNQPPPPRLPNATGPGNIRLDGRRDIRDRSQVSALRFYASGTLVDFPFSLDYYSSRRAPIYLLWDAVIPTGAGVVGKLYDADTNQELSLLNAGSNWRKYSFPAGQNAFFAAFTLTSDPGQTVTPFLWGYTVTKDGIIDTPPRTPFQGGALRAVSITGPESDPSHETARVDIADVKNELAKVRKRSGIRVRLETQYDQADPTRTTALFDGYADRSTSIRKGWDEGQDYPSPLWSDFDSAFLGMWKRLYQTLTLSRIDLSVDRAFPNAPRKVTDVVRNMISRAGFADDQIDVPDNPMRFWPAPGNEEYLLIEPLTSVGEWVPKALKDYLGWFLIWDGNAGSRGMWRARPASVAPYRNLAVFKTAAPSGKLSVRPESYGSTNWTGTDLAPVNTFIRKGTLQTYVKPPEANKVVVTTTGMLLPDKSGMWRLSNWAANPDSYDWGVLPDGSIFRSADPENPDYIGYEIPLYIIDPAVGGSTDWEIQENVDWLVRRYYDVTCHAIKMATFEAPLVLVTDTQDTVQTSPRPLRYYDAVQIDDGGVLSQWLVRNVNPTYRKDSIQLAVYELQSPRV